MNQFHPKSRSGFSLPEILAALAVMLVLIVMVLQIINGTTRSISHGTRYMDADTEARMLFGRISADFSQMLKRRDIDYTQFKQPVGQLPDRYDVAGSAIVSAANLQPGNDRLAFLAETSGYFNGSKRPAAMETSPVSLVAYQVQDDPDTGAPGLARLARGLGWETGTTGTWNNVAYLPRFLSEQWPGLFAGNMEFKAVADQTFRLEYVYLMRSRDGQPGRLSLTPWYSGATLDPPHTSVDGFRDVAAIVVTIAVLDRTSRATAGKDYSALISALPDATADSTGNIQNVAAVWNAIVNNADFPDRANLPRQAASSVRIYERVFPLDTQP